MIPRKIEARATLILYLVSLISDSSNVRFICYAGFSMFRVSVDGMPLQVVEIDGSPVDPLNIPFFIINSGQRIAFNLDFSKLDLAAVSNSDSIYFRVEGIPDMYPTYDPSDPIA